MKRSNFERLRSLIDRVTIHTDSVQHFLEQRSLKQTGSPISCFVLLDHMDWLTCRRAPQLADEWQAILGSATSDARFVWRSLGVDKEFIDSVHVDVHGHPRSIGQLLGYDYSAMTHLMLRERVSVYGGLFIAKLGTRPDSIY